MGYNEVKDQTRYGISGSGKEAGEVDILISKDGKEVAIFEGLKLSNVNTAYIDSHVEKAITNYNALGTATFIVSYVSTSNFENFWNRFLEFLETHKFSLDVKRKMQNLFYSNALTRVAKTVLSLDGYDFPTYFIIFKL